MGITRCPVECPGCKTGIVLRLGVGHEKRQAFFYVCPKCQAATKGALIWDGGAGTRLELADGRKLKSEKHCTEVVTINPEIPAFAGAKSMAEPGGSAFITFFQWLGGDGIQQCQGAFYQMRHLLDSDWNGLSRLTTYYLNRDWKHYDAALEGLLPEEHRSVSADWMREHHIHYLYELLFSAIWVLDPGKNFMEMKVAWNALWSPDRPHFKNLVPFAQAEVNTPLFESTQRALFEQIGRYVNLMSAMFPGLLCDMLPEKHQPEVDRLRLFRDEFELLRDLYIQGFETSHKVLRWVIGTLNADIHGDPNRFLPVPGMNPQVANRPPKNLDAFTNLPNASKRGWLIQFPEWHKRLPTGLIQRDDRPPLPYTRFVQQVHRILHPLLACITVLKIMRIYSTVKWVDWYSLLLPGATGEWASRRSRPRAEEKAGRFGRDDSYCVAFMSEPKLRPPRKGHPRSGKCKPYQVKQVRNVITNYRLAGEADA